MQYFMTLLEQHGNEVVKGLATGTRLDEAKFMFAWSSDWTTLLPLRETLTAIQFKLCQFLKQYVFHCTRYPASRRKRHKGVVSFY